MKGKRIVSLLLCLVLTLSLLPASVLAVSNGDAYCFNIIALDNGKLKEGFTVSAAEDGEPKVDNKLVDIKGGEKIKGLIVGKTVTVTFTAPTGYVVDSAVFYCYDDLLDTIDDLVPKVTKSDGGRIAQIVFTPTEENLQAADDAGAVDNIYGFYLAVILKKAGNEKSVTFYPYQSDKSKFYTVNVEAGKTLSQPTVAEIESKAKLQDGYFDAMEVEGWYTDEALSRKYDFTSPVSQDLSLYAKMQLKKDAKISVEYRVSIKAKPNAPTYDRSAYYNPETKKISFENPGLTINVGIPVTGLPIGKTITSDDLGLPKSGLTITGWVLADTTTGKKTPYEEGKTAITADQALALLASDKCVTFLAVYTGTSLVSFNSNGHGGTVPADMEVPFEWNGDNGTVPTLTEPQRKTLTDWVKEQDKKTNYFFRGWYTNAKCTGDAWVLEAMKVQL